MVAEELVVEEEGVVVEEEERMEATARAMSERRVSWQGMVPVS